MKYHGLSALVKQKIEKIITFDAATMCGASEDARMDNEKDEDTSGIMKASGTTKANDASRTTNEKGATASGIMNENEN